MNDRVRGLRMNRSCTALRIGIGVLLLTALVVGEGITADAKSDYEIINTGIKGGGCWYDDNHFIVVKGQQPAPGQDFEVEGLYYLDPHQPKDLKRIDLAPLEPSLQRRIRDVTCQDETILFHILTADKKRNTIYSLKIGRSPTVVVAKQEGFILPRAINVRERYVLGVTNTIMEPHSPHAEQAVKDCNFASLMDGHRVFCLRHDRGTKQYWLANDTILTQYLWDETIRVGQEGAYRWVRNPEPPLKLPDGTELKQGYLLRDLENRIVQEIPMKQDPYQVVNFQLDPLGMYLYGVCYKAGDHGERHLTVGGRICRFRLDGKSTKWEEVVAVQQSPDNVVGLHQLQVNERGDLVALQLKRGANTIWKYTAATHRVDTVRQVPSRDDLGGHRLSPTGRWMSFSEQGTLHFAYDKGGRP